jgi:crotonobetainyl-CoA:carnitine CoA-transferase CaiB-like acyl-CoA transferase
VNGFGDGGPLRQRPAYNTIGQSFGGLYSLLGPGGSAQLSGTIFADLVTGLCTTTGAPVLTMSGYAAHPQVEWLASRETDTSALFP